MTGEKAPGFLLDEHVPVAVSAALRERGVDAVHVLEESLGGTSDPELMRWCQDRGRILVTRNYKDFAPLVEMLNRRNEAFPGVLFLSSGIGQADVGAHARVLDAWLRPRDDVGSSVTSTFGWLGKAGD